MLIELRCSAQRPSYPEANVLDTADGGEDAQRRTILLVGGVAHDLRTPLAAISGYAQLVARPSTPPEVRGRALDTIGGLTRRMDRMLGELLDAARLGADALAVDPAPMDLAALVRLVVEQRRSATPARRIVLDVPDHLLGTWDEDRLARVVDNLVGNAVKYSPDGTEVRVSLRAEGEHAVLCVADDGIGIAPDQLDGLFAPFARLTTNRDGTGLGLYTSQAAVRAHGGRLWVESDGLGRGARFAVAVPLDPPPARSAAAARERRE